MSSDTITLRNKTASPLLRLPRELHDKIHGFAFDSVTLLNRPPKSFANFSEALAFAMGRLRLRLVEDGAGLLSTCRQLRHETLSFRSSYLHVRVPACDMWVLAHIAVKAKRDVIRSITFGQKFYKECIHQATSVGRSKPLYKKLKCIYVERCSTPTLLQSARDEIDQVRPYNTSLEIRVIPVINGQVSPVSLPVFEDQDLESEY